jgi:hypothetical protein
VFLLKPTRHFLISSVLKSNYSISTKSPQGLTWSVVPHSPSLRCSPSCFRSPKSRPSLHGVLCSLFQM